MNAMMNTETAVNRVGIIRTPNQPMYKRFSVEVTHSQKRAHSEVDSRLSKIAVIRIINCLKNKKLVPNGNQ